MDDLVLFLALRLAACATQADFARMLLASGDVRRAHAAGLWPVSPRHWDTAHRQALALRTLGIHVLYNFQLPSGLLVASPPPAALFVRGETSLLKRSAIAIVGSRHAADDALVWTRALATDLARRGHLVVSGGASGVDAAAHRGALAGGGTTLAYVGSCIDLAYPAHNRPLFQHIMSHGGAIVSEHPPLANTRSYHHAARNRFIAAHAHTLVVAQAAEKSGTLTTVRWSSRLGRAVFVSPPGVGRQRAGIDALLATRAARVWQGDAASA